MPRSRNIKPSFFHDVDLIELSPLHRLLFAGLWCYADREGRLIDNPKQLKHDILPGDQCDMDTLLSDLRDAHFIVRYVANNQRLIQIANFSKHQNPHVKEPPSIYPEPASPVLVRCEPGASPVLAETKTMLAALIPDSLNLIPDSCKLIPDCQNRVSAPSEKNVVNTDYEANSVDFEDFLSRWSRHRGFKKPNKYYRTVAAERWPAAKLTDSDLDAALDGFEESEWGKKEGYPILGFLKDPHSWISRERPATESYFPVVTPPSPPPPPQIASNRQEDFALQESDYEIGWNARKELTPVGRMSNVERNRFRSVIKNDSLTKAEYESILNKVVELNTRGGATWTFDQVITNGGWSKIMRGSFDWKLRKTASEEYDALVEKVLENYK